MDIRMAAAAGVSNPHEPRQTGEENLRETTLHLFRI
jgi:hypothetical protein